MESEEPHWPLPDLAFRCLDWDSLEYEIPKGLGCSSGTRPSAWELAFRAGLGVPGSARVRGMGVPLICQEYGLVVAGPAFLVELWAPSAAGRYRRDPEVLIGRRKPSFSLVPEAGTL